MRIIRFLTVGGCSPLPRARSVKKFSRRLFFIAPLFQPSLRWSAHLLAYHRDIPPSPPSLLRLFTAARGSLLFADKNQWRIFAHLRCDTRGTSVYRRHFSPPKHLELVESHKALNFPTFIAIPWREASLFLPPPPPPLPPPPSSPILKKRRNIRPKISRFVFTRASSSLVPLEESAAETLYGISSDICVCVCVCVAR